MKVVSLLTMIAAVGILGAAILFMSGQKSTGGLGVKASPSKTLNGTVVSSDPEGCAKSFYLGCYKLTSSGVTYDLVEDSGSPALSSFAGKSVRVVGRIATVKGRDILMVTSINVNP